MDQATIDYYNNLHEALCQFYSMFELHDLKEEDEFREQTVKETETNSEIQEQLSHDEHKYYLYINNQFRISTELIGAGGGKKSRSKNVRDGQTAKLKIDEKSITVWQKNKQVDKDLTITGPLNNELLNKLRTDAINEALQYCNKYLAQIQGVDDTFDDVMSGKEMKHVFVRPYMFRVTKYDRIFVRKSMGDVTVGCFPVEMRATIEVLDKVSRKQTKKRVPLVVEINFDNPCVSPVKHGPQVPHVGYKISGPKNTRFKRCGHITVNKEGNEYLPHRRPDNVEVDPTWDKITPAMQYKIPISRLFNGPSISNLVLERTDSNYQKLDRSKIRGKTFVTIFY